MTLPARGFATRAFQGGNLLRRPLAASQGQSAEGPFGGARFCQHFLPAVRRRRVSVLDPIRRNRLGRLARASPNSVVFAASRMPWLPMLSVWGGIQKDLKTAKQPSTGRSAPTQKVRERESPTHAGPKERKPSEHEPGPQRRPRHPHRERSGNFKESELESLR